MVINVYFKKIKNFIYNIFFQELASIPNDILKMNDKVFGLLFINIT